jgi:hypothetical protein
MKHNKPNSYSIIKNGEEDFKIYPYKNNKDAFIISIFKNFISTPINGVKFIDIEPAKIPDKNITTFNELILNDIETKNARKDSPKNNIVPKKKNIGIYKNF